MKAVTSKRLLMTLRAREFLAGAVVICEVWILAVAL
jgi:hypothetical protein